MVTIHVITPEMSFDVLEALERAPARAKEIALETEGYTTIVAEVR